MLAKLPFVFVYLDDIIVASKSMEQHQQDEESVFRRLLSAGLVIPRRSASLQSLRSSSLAIMSLLGVLGHLRTGWRQSRTILSLLQLSSCRPSLEWVNCFVPPVKNPAAPYGLTEGKGGLKATATVEWTREMEKALLMTKLPCARVNYRLNLKQGW